MRRGRAVRWLTSLCTLALPAFANASAWTVEPDVAFQSNYDSNRLLAVEPYGTTELRFMGQAALRRATERSEIEIRPRADLRRYPGNDALDSDNGGLSAGMEWIGELTRSGLQAELASDSTIISERSETGVLDASTRRESWSVDATWLRALSPRRRIDARWSHLDVEYPDGASVGLIGYHYPNGSIGFDFDHTERMGWRVDVAAGELTAPLTGYRSSNVSLQIGMRRELSPRTQLRLSGGISRAEVLGTDDEGYVGAASLTHKGLLTSGGIDLEHSIAPTGYGVLVRRSEARLHVHRQFGAGLSGSLNLRSVLNDEIVPAFESRTRLYTGAQGILAWRVRAAWYLNFAAGYARARYPRVEPATDTDTEAEGWRAALGLRWAPGEQPAWRWE